MGAIPSSDSPRSRSRFYISVTFWLTYRTALWVAVTCEVTWDFTLRVLAPLYYGVSTIRRQFLDAF